MLITFFSLFILLAVLFFWSRKKINETKEFINLIHPDFRRLRFFPNGVLKTRWKKVWNFFTRASYRFSPQHPDLEIKKMAIAGYGNRDLAIDIFQPKSKASNQLPCILALHSGGFWMSASSLHKSIYQDLALALNCRVVVPHYSLTIDHPFPAALEDAYETAKWIFDNSAYLKIDPHNIALYGDSAGGNLAAGLTQILRDRGNKSPIFQMLIYPILDTGLNSISAKKYETVPVWNTRLSRDALKYYLPEGEATAGKYAFPIRTKNLQNLPPAFIEISEFDSLRDEGAEYADLLEKAGVEVELREIYGAVHAFELNPRSAITQDAMKLRINRFKKVFSSSVRANEENLENSK